MKDIASGSQYDTSQMVAAPSGGNRYIALNTAEPPFDDINVRKAVIANSDRVALREHPRRRAVRRRWRRTSSRR